MLNVKNMSVDYGATRVVHDLDLALGDDEIVTLVGPTGCGKTTVLQAVAGLVPMAAGEVSLSGWRATPDQWVPPEKRGIGMVFQDFALFPHLTVEKNIGFRLDDPAIVDHWLARLGLEDKRHARPGTLSGGQKQRVALARALAHSPKLMLLDEPLSNLDAALKDSLRREIRDALKAAGVPALWVTHDQDEALSVGDRLGVLHRGRLEQLDHPETCFERPATRFVAGFLGEASFLAGELHGDQALTALGTVPAWPVDAAHGAVDLLLRPDDAAVSAAEGEANGRVRFAQYEGGTWLYAVALDHGMEVQVRTSHETRLQVDDRVRLWVTTTHPLAAFTRPD